MIIKEHNCIHIHIPKCAGSTIECVLGGGQYVSWDDSNKIWMPHATAQQIKKFYCKGYDEYFSFSFVRNPWDRSLSDYLWMQKDLRIRDTFKNFLLLQGSFDDERLKCPPKSHTTRHDHLLCQCDFLLNENGQLMVDFVGKFENLQEGFDTVCDEIGIAHQQLPHTNKGNHKHYTQYYDDETREIVAEKYAKDIAAFGYKFGE